MTDATDAVATRDGRDGTAIGASADGAQETPLGRDFGKLWTAAAFSNLADGLGRTAVPLIATTLTRDPLAISAHRRTRVPAVARVRPAGGHDRRPVRPPRHHGGRERHPRRRRARGSPSSPRPAASVCGRSSPARSSSGWARRSSTTRRTPSSPASSTRPQLDRANGRMQAAQITIDNFIATPIARRALRRRARAAAVGRRRRLPRSDRPRALLPLSAARPLRDRALVPDRDAPDIEVARRARADRHAARARRRCRPAKRSSTSGTTATCGRWWSSPRSSARRFSFAQARDDPLLPRRAERRPRRDRLRHRRASGSAR